MLANGFPEANPPIMILIDGTVNKYNTTIKSPRNVCCVCMTFIHKIVDTRMTLESPTTGAAKKVNLDAPSGINVSLPNSLITSNTGCKTGGPTRYCTRAVTFRSTQLVKSPSTAVKQQPNTIK